MAQVIYITWQERGHANVRQEYIGGGVFATRGDEALITKRARYSSDVTPAMIDRANAYIRENMQDDRLNIKVEVLNDKE